MSSYKKKFCGKHVLITGGSEGIGLALGKDFVRAGANVTLLARNKDKLEAAETAMQGLAQECASNSRVHVESADVTSFDLVGCMHACMMRVPPAPVHRTDVSLNTSRTCKTNE